jgi:hypothetical protein
MLKNGDINSLRVGDKICLFKREGVIPIACGLFEYFDEKHDKICISVNERSIELTNYLYDFVSASALNKFGPASSSEEVRHKYMQFSGIMENESKA